LARSSRRDASRKAIYDEHEGWYPAFIAGSEAAAEFTAVARAQLESQVSDPVLRAKLWPDYPIGCKRIVICDDFYPAIVRPNVTLETDGVAGIEAHGIRKREPRLDAAFEVVDVRVALAQESLGSCAASSAVVALEHDRRVLGQPGDDGADA
jgi:cation diffusion facilitator CzcD-associated flavoprotein CzcO